MPATVLFIKLNLDCCIPIRIFVNRKRVLLSSRVAINEKSIIQLSSISLIRLSNYDVTNLVFDIKAALKEFLLDIPIENLFPNRALLRNLKVSRELGDQWKCKVVASLGYIADLRYKLGFIQKDLAFLEDKGIAISVTDGKNIALLTKEIKFNFPVLKEDDDEVEPSNDKKGLDYKLHRARVINSRVTDLLDLFVLLRPRG